ncbi:MAG: DNA repair protein RadC, partial [uncultured Sulfurovum sp.]
SVNATIAKPMEVFSLALQKRAVKIMICHNHPSGELKPSSADKDVTDRLIQVGIIVDTPVIDHLIISEKSYLSFADIGLFDTLKQSTKYVPAYELAERIRKEATEIAVKRRDIEIAKNLKRDGVDVDTIVKYTGLSVEEVNNLRVRRKK